MPIADVPPAMVDAPPVAPIDCTGATGPVLSRGSGFTSLRVHAMSASFKMPGMLIGDGAGNLFSQDPQGNGVSGDKIFAISGSGVVTTLAAPANYDTCTQSQLGRDSAGNLYVWSFVGAELVKFTPAGVMSNFSNAGGLTGGGSCVTGAVVGISVRSDGSFFLASPATNKIYTLSANGATRTDFASVPVPMALVDDGNGGVFAASGAPAPNPRIVHVASDGSITTVLGAGMYPTQLARDPTSGTIYFAQDNFVYKTDATGSYVQEVAGCFQTRASGVALDRSTGIGGGMSLYVMQPGATTAASDGDAIYEIVR